MSRALSRRLGAIFSPPAQRKPDTQRKAREEAKRLAAECGVELERWTGYSGIQVWPPKGTVADPYEGDHHAQDWAEALEMVKHYHQHHPKGAQP